jgi:hypothetical protein
VHAYLRHALETMYRSLQKLLISSKHLLVQCQPTASLFEINYHIDHAFVHHFAIFPHRIPANPTPAVTTHQAPNHQPILHPKLCPQIYTVGQTLAEADPQLVKGLKEGFMEPKIGPSDAADLGEYPNAVRQFLIQYYILVNDKNVPEEDKKDIMKLLFDGDDLYLPGM